jgi:anti-sigma regulatory factor (Ser/Thr protein kinase)
MNKPNQLTLKERNRLVQRKNNGKFRRKITSAEKTTRRLKTHNPYHYDSKRQVPNINLPKIFDLHTNIDETLEVMNKFRNIVDKKDPRLKKLNFSNMQYINSSSALMLAAEIDVWNSKASQQLHAQHKTWNNEIKHLLCELGFFELLGMETLKDQQKIEKNTTFLKFISGQKAGGKKAKELREAIESVIGKDLEDKMHLYEGLTEAFTNTTQHAYDKNNPNNFDKWWMTAAYKSDKKKLIVSMYDRGKSIPKTIHKYKKWNEVKTYLSMDGLKNHSRLIEAAMQVSFDSQRKTRTKTQQSHRGKGLKQLLDFIKNNGKLTIISGKGKCIFTVKNNKLNSIKGKRLKYPLKGTLIEWEINLPQS